MSRADYHVVIVGAGPAGSAAAIQLVGRGYRVLLLEKSVFPREKLCGEFLSTEVAAICRRLRVLEAMKRAGARPVRFLELTDDSGGAFRDELPGTALSMSRMVFDHLLFQRAAEAGADAADGEEVRSIDGTLGGGFTVQTERRTITAGVAVGAYGRRTLLDRRLGRRFLQDRSAFIGFKARFEGRPREATIELHAFPGGYCGLLQDEDAATNVCWMARADRLREAGGSAEEMIEYQLCGNPRLRRRFEELSRTGDFLAVGQLSFRAKGLFAGDVCMIGDAAGMIAPLCGDGMGMALRTSELAAPLIGCYLEGDLSAAAFRARYSAAWRREFATRMRLGRWLNAVLTRPVAGRLAVRAARVAPAAARAAIAATRG